MKKFSIVGFFMILICFALIFVSNLDTKSIDVNGIDEARMEQSLDSPGVLSYENYDKTLNNIIMLKIVLSSGPDDSTLATIELKTKLYNHQPGFKFSYGSINFDSVYAAEWPDFPMLC